MSELTLDLLEYASPRKHSSFNAIAGEIERIGKLPISERIEAINTLRAALHEISPFKDEPVDFVRWVKSSEVHANDYNPNSVAPPEMELLRVSIMNDGYTQPIVTNKEDDGLVVIDGFHRNRVGKECKDVISRVHGYLPVVQIKENRSDRSSRMASTIRHNRARGKHKVEAMSDIVIELKRRNWSDARISKELGMDEDEILRLCQITGLADVFKDQEFSEAWEVDNKPSNISTEILSDVISDFEPNDGERIFHTWEKWECYRAGFYNERPPKGVTQEQGQELYREFLSDEDRFEVSLKFVIENWKFSCEHSLTNDRMNRIAWLGQASACHAIGMPSGCRGGYNLLDDGQKKAADELALKYLNKWLVSNSRQEVDMSAARGRTEAELY